MFDTHCHLNHPDFQADWPQVLDRARQAGLDGAVIVGYDLLSSRLAVEMARPEEDLYAAVGIHPHDAEKADRGAMAELASLARRSEVVAIGETGLDFYRNLSPRQAQIDAFRRHIDLAAQLYLTLIVHDRDAHDEVFEVLASHAPPHLRVILHCYSAGPDMLDEAIRRGWWISLAGNVTYPRASALRAVAASVPADRLLVETDAPYLPPQPYRGRRNEPAFLRETISAIATARGEPEEQVRRQTTRNAMFAFGLLIDQAVEEEKARSREAETLRGDAAQ